MKASSFSQLPFGVVLTTAMTTMVVIAVVGFTLVSVRQDRQLFRSELEEQASLILDGVAEASRDELYNLNSSALLDTLTALQKKPMVLSGAFYDSQGRLIADSSTPDVPVFDLIPEPLGEKLVFGRQPWVEWQADRLVAGRPMQVGTQMLGAISVELSTEQLESKIRAAQIQGGVIAVAALVAGILISFLVSRSISRPISKFVETMTRVSQGDLGHHVSVNGSREFSQLALALNEMIDARSNYETLLEESHEQALLASQAKSEFLASMSHEIRTPMNAIIGMADLLSETSLSQEQRKYVQVFQASGETLLALINDILDISKIESGQLLLESTPFDLGQLVEDAALIFAIRAHQKGLELNTQVHPKVITSRIGDPIHLRQIICNLLANAIKFTQSGEVILWVGLDAPGFLRFQVSDTGIGIPQDKQSIIFDSFTQADSSVTRQYGGTGLGLSICRRLVEMMGGRIWVESKVGQGSAFYFTVPLEVQTEVNTAADPALEKMKGLRVLIVNNNPTSQVILTQILETWGALPTVADDGDQCRAELSQAIKQENPYEILLLDGRTRGIDGLEISEWIKGDPGIADKIIMMLTSDTWSQDIARYQELGISQFLRKPVGRLALLQAVTATLNPTPAIAKAPKTLKSEHALRILLVEDNQDNRLLVQTYLKQTTYHIDVAENGEIAVGKFTSGHYDLVLMDVQMPVMDGYSATRAIRNWEQGQGVRPTPIIALTANALLEDSQKSLDAGCTYHMTKPVKKAALVEAVREYASKMAA